MLGESTTSRVFTLFALEFGHLANLSDEVQEFRTFDTGELLAEKGNDETDVSTQRGVALLGRNGVVGREGVAHVASSIGRLARPLRHGGIVLTATTTFLRR